MKVYVAIGGMAPFILLLLH